MSSLLNLNNIPNHQLSGNDTNELDWITQESNDRFLIELSDEFINFINDAETTSIPQSVMDELDEMERNSIPKSSMKQMENTVKRFTSFLCEKKLSTNLKDIPVNILNNYLRYFYAQLRTQNGSYYAPPSLICIRAALHRHFMLIRQDVNIVNDHRFEKSNRMLASMVQNFKKSNQTKERDVYPAIEKSDMHKIMQYFDRSNSEVLQNEVIFHLIYHFGFRGRETLPLLTQGSFCVKVDSDQREYVALNHDLLSKNAKSSIKPSEFEDLKKARMYAFPEDPGCCPVTAYKLYMNKISNNNSQHLFPKPCKNFSKGLASHVWYVNKQVTGTNTLCTLMGRLSDKLKLSKHYTNHCIRVTHITILKENGFTNAEIATNTGHKNAGSIERYSRKRRDSDLSLMSNTLSLEASSKNVVIRKIGTKGKITAVQEVSDESLQPVCKFEFSGTFNNCTFKLENA